MTTDWQEIFSIVLLTLRICTISTLLSAVIAIPLGLYTGLIDNRVTRTLRPLLSAFTGLPPVIAGVVVYLLFSRDGVLGPLDWLYTPKAITVAQMLIVVPIIASQLFPAVDLIRKDYLMTGLGLGLTRKQLLLQLPREMKATMLAALIAGFGRAIAEVGAVTMVGGNIRFKTRVMTSAIVLETNKGNYPFALRLGILLMAISLLVSFLSMALVKGKKRD